MSELTLCNYCRMQSIERDAKKQGKRIVKIPSERCNIFGGREVRWEVHSIKKNEVLSGKNWICWMWEITDHCVC